MWGFPVNAPAEAEVYKHFRYWHYLKVGMHALFWGEFLCGERHGLNYGGDFFIFRESACGAQLLTISLFSVGTTMDRLFIFAHAHYETTTVHLLRILSNRRSGVFISF